LMLPMYAQELIDLGVSHVTVTMNTISPQIGAQIYQYVNYMGFRYTGEQGATILLANQLAGIKYLTDHGIVCKINIVMLKGINDGEIESVVQKAKDLHCEITNIMQLIPVKGSTFEDMPLVSNKEITAMRKKCEGHMKQMYHCRQCRADAVGTLDNDESINYQMKQTANVAVIKKERQRFAVATKSGMLVDQHFGHAQEFYIYESDGKTANFIEKRNVDKYCNGPDVCEDKVDKIESILQTIKDCSAVLALRVGESPSRRLEALGIRIVVTYDRIEEAVKKAANQ